MTHYEILGLDKWATTEEIKAKRDQLARIYHPDKNKSPEAAERMKEINEAYAVLSDNIQRADYDRALEAELMQQIDLTWRKLEQNISR